MRNGNARHTIIFYDTHRFGKHLAKNIIVTLTKCESNEANEFFLLTKSEIDWNENNIQSIDQVFRKPMEAMCAAINLWNQTVMENPVTDEAHR